MRLLFRAVSGTLVLIVSLGLWGCRGGEEWSQEEIDRTIRLGDSLVEAISNYRGARGYLPRSLDDVSLDQGIVADRPTVGNGTWDYSMYDEGANFELRVWSSESWGATLIYSSRLQKWWIDKP